MTNQPKPNNIVEFKRPSKTQQKKRSQQKAKGSTLCLQGHHKWKLVTESKFDTKEGKLVTVYECERCGKEKITAH